jgi:glycosyltransferase involved in cell wall biosynthesis
MAELMKRRIVHVVGNLALSSGGPSRTITGMAKRIGDAGPYDVSIVTQTPLSGGTVAVDPKVQLVECSNTSNSRSLLELPILRALEIVHDKSPVHAVISHGLWTPTNLQAAMFSRRVGCPLVIQPHGMLSPWALQHHRYRKAIAGAVFQWRDLENATALIATSEAEFRIFRALGLNQPILVSPNGIDRPEFLCSHRVKNNDQGVALFLGRLHPVKGLDNLLEAWSHIKPVNWKLIIAGPDEGGYQSHLQYLVEKLGICDVIFNGPVFDDEKAELFKMADVFVLPSHTENFGVSVLEAMSYGLPIVTTKGTPWHELTSRCCGWWVAPDAPSLAKALSEVIALSPRDRLKMGLRAMRFSREFEWDRIADQLCNFIGWLVNHESPPSNLRLE